MILTQEQLIMQLWMGTTGIMVIVLLWIGWMVWKTKRLIRKQVEYERQVEHENQGY